MKLICVKTVNGVTAVRNITTPAVGNQWAYVKTIVGVGNPFTSLLGMRRRTMLRLPVLGDA